MHCIFFIFWGLFLLLYILFLCMDGSGVWTSWSVSLCPSFRLISRLHSEVCILTHFAFAAWFVTCEELKTLKRRKFSSSHLGCWDCSFVCWEEMGCEVRCRSPVRAQGPWRGFILLISTCWSLSQLVWAATVLCWFDSRDVRAPATVRPLLAQTSLKSCETGPCEKKIMTQTKINPQWGWTRDWKWCLKAKIPHYF